MADKIVVMNQGRIEQAGKPLELYYKPANLFVARFIGSPAMNVLAAQVAPGGTTAQLFGSAITLPKTALVTGRITIGFRPEHCSIGKTGIPATTDIVERLGETGFVHCKTGDGQAIVVEVKGDPGLANGDSVFITPDPVHTHVFDEVGKRIGV